jgi:uncharacterized membrane protein YdfJ with MMPL/SSD domain
MRKRRTLLISSAVLAAAAIPAVALGIGDSDIPIGPADVEAASAAALRHLGSGRVTGTEVGDEESYYEVEVTLADGRQVDVQLDRSFAVVEVIGDGSEATEASEP